MQDSDGHPLGPIAIGLDLAKLVVEPGQAHSAGETKDLEEHGLSTNGFITVPNYGALRFEVVDGASHLAVNSDGGLTGLSEGDATLVASVDTIKSDPVTVHVYGPTLYPRTVDFYSLAFLPDPTRNRFLLTSTVDNAIVPFDPVTGTLGTKIVVGQYPNVLALSDDASTLYVGNEHAYTIQLVDLVTSTAGTAFRAVDGVLYGTHSLSVAPGSPGTVASAPESRLGADLSLVSVFDGSVRRPQMGPPVAADALLRTAPNRLLASLGTTLQDCEVDTQGVHLIRTVNDGPNPVGGLTLVGGRVYTNFGGVYDATSLTKLGAFTPPTPLDPSASIYSGPAIDPARNRAYFVEYTADRPLLHVYRLDTFDRVTDRVLFNANPRAGGSGLRGHDLLRWGASDLALRDSATPPKLFCSTTSRAFSPRPIEAAPSTCAPSESLFPLGETGRSEGIVYCPRWKTPYDSKKRKAASRSHAEHEH